MSKGNSSKRISAEDLLVRLEDRPGWVIPGERVPDVGEPVYCVGGTGVIHAVLGKTGNGSRLLEIHLDDPDAKPFFAAASNVLVPPK